MALSVKIFYKLYQVSILESVVLTIFNNLSMMYCKKIFDVLIKIMKFIHRREETYVYKEIGVKNTFWGI